MSACKTGCGKETLLALPLCDPCAALWRESDEYARFWLARSSHEADRSFVDFCNRLRAERLNGGTNESK